MIRPSHPRLTAVGLAAMLCCSSGCFQDSNRIKALEKEVAQLHRQQQSGGQRVVATAQPGTPTWPPIRHGAILSVDGQALFYAGQARLKDGGLQMLNQIASDIRARFSDKEIYVLGHTDNDPIQKTAWVDNRELSAARAVAVVRVLEDQGIAPGRLIAAGCGEHRPVGANHTPDGKARNRRIEIVAVTPLLAAPK